jgi:hypothetical protein
MGKEEASLGPDRLTIYTHHCMLDPPGNEKTPQGSKRETLQDDTYYHQPYVTQMPFPQAFRYSPQASLLEMGIFGSIPAALISPITQLIFPYTQGKSAHSARVQQGQLVGYRTHDATSFPLDASVYSFHFSHVFPRFSRFLYMMYTVHTSTPAGWILCRGVLSSAFLGMDLAIIEIHHIHCSSGILIICPYRVGIMTVHDKLVSWHGRLQRLNTLSN